MMKNMMRNQTIIVIVNDRGWDNPEMFSGIRKSLHGVHMLAAYVLETKDPGKYRGRSNFFVLSSEDSEEAKGHGYVIIHDRLDDGDLIGLTAVDFCEGIFHSRTPAVLVSHACALRLKEEFEPGKALIVIANGGDTVEEVVYKIKERVPAFASA